MKFKKLASALLVSLLLASAAIPAVSALTPYGTGILMRNWLKNDPNYQFSEAYMTSVWYENFTSLELTENDRNNVLRIAISQLGYHEGDSAADFHGKNTNGSGNYIEYARLLTPNWSDNAYEWCACFVNWCLNQARFDKASSEISCRNWVNELTAMNMYQKSKAHGGSYTPRPADFIFFNWDGKASPANHIGLVLYTTETHVYTIEGNTAGNNVDIRSYALSDARIAGYGTPPYNEGNEPILDLSHTDSMTCGTYIVQTYDAVLTSAPHGGEQICALPAGSSVYLHDVEGDMARVTYGDQEGYVATDVLWLMTRGFTLSFDANGGENPPVPAKPDMGIPYDLTDEIPTLEGDTFLGWSLSPYTTIPDYTQGSPISVGQDTTLYAVWEKHSLKLAEAAFDEGKAPVFSRPETIQNSAALLLGTLADTSLFIRENATVSIVTDDTLGSVLSMAVGQGEAEASVTLDYAALVSALSLAPVHGQNIEYAVLKVKAEMANTASWYISFNSEEGKTASPVTSDEGWQYAVIDLTQDGFEGELQTIEFGLLTTDDTVSFLLADLFFVSTAEQVDALVKGGYIFPAQEPLPPEISTETTTEEESTVDTQPMDTDGGTESPVDTTSPSAPTETNGETEPFTGGCASSLAMTALIGMILPLTAFIALRKKED